MEPSQGSSSHPPSAQLLFIRLPVACVHTLFPGLWRGVDRSQEDPNPRRNICPVT